MIKVKTIKNGNVKIRMKGEPMEVLEELLNATIRIIEMLVEKGKLPKEHVIDFIDDFAQQVKEKYNSIEKSIVKTNNNKFFIRL